MVAHRLKRPTRGLGRAALEHPLIWPCSGWGLPSQPGHPGCWCALTAPFHPYPDSAGRFVFCGTFPRVTPGGRYPPPCPVEPGLSSRRLLLRAAAQPTPVDISYSSTIACTTGGRQAPWRGSAPVNPSRRRWRDWRRHRPPRFRLVARGVLLRSRFFWRSPSPAHTRA